MSGLAEMFTRMRQDIATVRERDPAARSSLEVALAYPGVHAVWIHRLSHRLWKGGRGFPPASSLIWRDY